MFIDYVCEYIVSLPFNFTGPNLRHSSDGALYLIGPLSGAHTAQRDHSHFPQVGSVLQLPYRVLNYTFLLA